LQTLCKFCVSNQERLGFFFAGFDEQTQARGWQGREESPSSPASLEFEPQSSSSTRSKDTTGGTIQNPGRNDEKR